MLENYVPILLFLAIGAAVLALGVGLAVMVRTVWVRGTGNALLRVLPVAVMAMVQLLAMPQLISVVDGVVPEQTAFDGGVDALLGS